MYTLKGLKTFVGREGYGYNVTILRDGKKVCFAMDDASGGQVRFDWINKQEEALFNAEASKELWDCNGQMIPRDADILLGEMVSELEEQKRIKRWSKTKLVFRLKGDEKGTYRTMNSPYSQASCDWVRSKYADRVETIWDGNGVKVTP